jgi:hypothetical protein
MAKWAKLHLGGQWAQDLTEQGSRFRDMPINRRCFVILAFGRLANEATAYVSIGDKAAFYCGKKD